MALTLVGSCKVEAYFFAGILESVDAGRWMAVRSTEVVREHFRQARCAIGQMARQSGDPEQEQE